MAPLPKTALKESNLTHLSAGSAVPKSGHEVIQVEFVDHDGQTKHAFYKQLDNNYPEILAKISVATSVILRTILGDRAAEDRLVFDEHGEIVGTLSIAIEGFKPFHCGSETLPDDPQKREEVAPSSGTLMQHNIMELLFASWYLGNDDLHPKNIGLKGIIDYDMFFYWITKGIKGPREIGVNTGDRMALLTSDFANFPILQNDTCTHWPTRQFPGNLNYPKRYPNPGHYSDLASNLHYEDKKTSRNTTAQEQLFSAALKALLTYQPEVLQKRLKDALGKTPLNYSSLAPEKQKDLETKFPELFNSETNVGPFTDFMMKLFQQNYDELYRKVVFFQGCESNCSNTAVPAFYQYLSDHPSTFHHIKEWMIEQNSKFKTDEKRQFNEDEIDHRYHSIWRNSYSLMIKDILSKARELSESLQQKLSLSHEALITAGKHHEDKSITEAWDLLKEFEERDMATLNCSHNSDHQHGLEKIHRLNIEFFECVKGYYQKDLNELTPLDNTQFIEQLGKLETQYFETVSDLGKGTSWGQSCADIGTRLHEFRNCVGFYAHLHKNDNKSLPLVPVRTITSHHTDQHVVDSCLQALFDWAKELSHTELSQKINKLLDNEYKGFLFSESTHSSRVKSYLRDSSRTPGDDRLAFILAISKGDSKNLNNILINSLIKDMSTSTQVDIQVYLPSVIKAFEEQCFDTDFYVKKAVNFAITNERFNHLYSRNAVNQINPTLYQWVDNIPSPRFQSCIRAALTQYEGKISYLTFYGKGSRRPEIEQMLRNPQLSHSEILKRIFSQRGVDPTSLNTCLFQEITQAMRADIPSDDEKLRQDNYRLFLQLSPDDTSFFMPQIQQYAQRTLHTPDPMARMQLQPA